MLKLKRLLNASIAIRKDILRENVEKKASRKYECDNNGQDNKTSSEREVGTDKHGAFVVANPNVEENVMTADTENTIFGCSIAVPAGT